MLFIIFITVCHRFQHSSTELVNLEMIMECFLVNKFSTYYSIWTETMIYTIIHYAVSDAVAYVQLIII